LFAPRSPSRGLIGVVVGALLYRVILATCFRVGIPPQYFQGLTAGIVIVFLALPFLLRGGRRRVSNRLLTAPSRSPVMAPIHDAVGPDSLPTKE